MAGLKGILVQGLTTLLLSSMAFAVGFSNCWPSYALQILESPDSPIGYQISSYEKNLIGSIGMLGSIPGVIIAGWVLNKIGPKRTIILCGIGTTLGWSLLTTAHSGTQIIIGRFLFGLFTGIHVVTIMIFISDITEVKLLGPFICSCNCIFTMGSLASYIEGWFCSYDVVNYSLLVLIVACTLLMFCVKDTPGFLLRKGKEKKALYSLKFYRGVTEANQDILEELLYIKSLQNEHFDKTDLDKVEPEKDVLNKELHSVIHIKEQSPWTILRKSIPARRALVIITVQGTFAAFMGMIAIQTYAGPLFQQAAPHLSSDVCAVLLAVIIIASTGLSVVTTDLIPRRVLMISSYAFATACQALLASLIRWSWAPQWAAPMLVVLFSFVFHIGVVVVPYVQLAECFSPQMKGFASGAILGCNFLASFVVLALFQPIVHHFGLDGVFFVFSIVGVIATVLFYFITRETRRMPLEVVQAMFEHGYLYRRPVTN